jgi:hypothetical protein
MGKGKGEIGCNVTAATIEKPRATKVLPGMQSLVPGLPYGGREAL